MAEHMLQCQTQRYNFLAKSLDPELENSQPQDENTIINSEIILPIGRTTRIRSDRNAHNDSKADEMKNASNETIRQATQLRNKKVTSNNLELIKEKEKSQKPQGNNYNAERKLKTHKLQSRISKAIADNKEHIRTNKGNLLIPVHSESSTLKIIDKAINHNGKSFKIILKRSITANTTTSNSSLIHPTRIQCLTLNSEISKNLI